MRLCGVRTEPSEELCLRITLAHPGLPAPRTDAVSTSAPLTMEGGKGMGFRVRSHTHQPKDVSERLQTPVSPVRSGHAVVCPQRLPGFTGDEPVMLSDVSTKLIVSVSLSFERGPSFGHLRTWSVYLAELSFSPLFGHILHQMRESRQLSPTAPSPMTAAEEGEGRSRMCLGRLSPGGCASPAPFCVATHGIGFVAFC